MVRGITRTSMLQEVDDIASVLIQQQTTDPSQMALFAKKVQTIIQRCMVSIGCTLGCTPSQYDIQQTFPVQPLHRRPREHVPERDARGVKRGARRHPGHGAGGGRPPVPPFPHRHEHVDPGHVEVERGEGSGASQSLPSGSGTSQTPSPPGLGFASFQPQHSTSFWFFGFRAPPPPSTADSSTLHQPISSASSFDEEKWVDDMNSVQHYGFEHRVGKKTTRFTPSDWP
ncbi:hypothetical protein M9H77_25271 [Catharanthus roseus]|uniref:Uncharacterized protein n=1 Tax=Catharanthus roseus TaxID=4058 RepID=A0ACC0A8Z6_CATRO|nr:hypothetical protein M9H77_25271 [Catharanthus roseus]